MNCDICMPDCPLDGNACESCARNLRPWQEWMAEVTQDDGWRDHWSLYSEIAGPDIDKALGFFAGAQLPYTVKLEPGFGRRAGKIVAIQNPCFEFIPRDSHLERMSELWESAKNF